MKDRRVLKQNSHIMNNLEYEFIRNVLIKRFLKYNHPKYHKYAEEWADNVIKCSTSNIKYFLKESNRYV